MSNPRISLTQHRPPAAHLKAIFATAVLSPLTQAESVRGRFIQSKAGEATRSAGIGGGKQVKSVTRS